MLELIYAGGWLMAPILICSVVATAIVLERAWTLRRARIMPAHLLARIWKWHRERRLTDARIEEIRAGSPLGRILAAALVNRHHAREVMKEAITDTGRHVVADLERFLNTLGTIAAIAPLLGLLGTVFGMIDIFDVIMKAGNGNASVLAGGISVALITTAAGLCVAIPALMFHRYFNGLVDQLAIDMEEQALRLVEVIKGEREEMEDQSVPAQTAPQAPPKRARIDLNALNLSDGKDPRDGQD
ncbi:MotA/TolQ/ExbB proton channel family protein [Thiobaca trueperi]|uniref:Biopolymer transport protein ExbB n=1 Tax=Thiobaca trueperi TaxID=127458 RepID=A0A4R3MSZ3_9GAMM|nr:MotA/TolQ/ExbB proton channel family protein [Thiobaca trueperi]TCT18847.1 biopolymer transport protein ExbB [Thiobaca trueperi]